MQPAMRRWLAALVAAVAVASWGEHALALEKMHVAFTWDQLSFRYESREQMEQLRANGTLIPGHSNPFDMDIDTKSDRVFIAMPRLMPGSGVSLATVENITERYNPRLQPYPDWSWHANASGCDGLTSVFRVEVDACGRLWVVDSGSEVTATGGIVLCPPQLLIFNLTTDELIIRHRFNMPTCQGTLMINVLTEHMDDRCSDDVYAYIADAGALQVLVYHLRTDTSWRVPSDHFFPDVNARTFRIYNTTFTKMTGVLGFALSPCIDGPNCDRYLYFQAFTGYTLGRVRTSILRNSQLFINGYDGVFNGTEIIGRRQTQSVAQAMTRDGVLFFGLLGEHSMSCWNQRNRYNTRNIHEVDYDYERIRIPIGVKLIRDRDDQDELWVINNNIQHVFAGQTFPNYSYPIYIIYGNVQELLNGTQCQLSG